VRTDGSWGVKGHGDDVSGVTGKEATGELKHTEHTCVNLPHQESAVWESVQKQEREKKMKTKYQEKRRKTWEPTEREGGKQDEKKEGIKGPKTIKQL